MKFKILTLSCLCAGALLLSGCDLLNTIKNKLGMTSAPTVVVAPTTPEGKVVARLNGKPALTTEEFSQFLQQVMQSNPYFKSMGVDALPGPIKQKVFDRIIDQRMIVAKAESMNLDQNEEFKKSLAKTVALVKSSLLVQMFEKNLLDSVTVDPADAQAEYEKNKHTYVKVSGGSLVEGAKFDNKSDAQAFEKSVKGDMSSFGAKARENKDAEFKEFGRVNEDPRSAVGSTMPAVLRTAALEMKKTPGTKLVEDGDATWVLYAYDKTEPIHFEFDELKDQLVMMLKRNKFTKILEEKLKELRSEFTLDVEPGFKEQFAAPQASPFGIHQENGQTVARMPVDALPIKKIQEQPQEHGVAVA